MIAHNVLRVFGRLCLVAAFAVGWAGQGLAAPSEEREISFSGGETPLDILGLPREVQGIRISGFVVGSFNYSTNTQMVPEFAGGVSAPNEPGFSNFRFDKVGISLSRRYAHWLSASASIEVESHRDSHAHGFDPVFACPGAGTCIERFGSESPETVAVLDRFNVTAVAPLGNGLALSLGRFDVPFGIERHDEPLLLTATTSEVFRFGRPQFVTGFQMAYQFNPTLDAAFFLANRWESETTHDEFDDNNEVKTVGGRVGLTPFPSGGLLNVGVGGFYGVEQSTTTSPARWVLDADVTWTPMPRLLFAGEVVRGGEQGVSMRELGIPYPRPAVVDAHVAWVGYSVLSHYDVVDWMGVSLRYGELKDSDGARTGVPQTLRSITVAPIVHLSRLIPDLAPTGATFARTQHPIDWVNLKLEYRYNRSDRPVFANEPPATDILTADKSSHQIQLQVAVNF